jgi:DNA-3-methyladenine glycosylase
LKPYNFSGTDVVQIARDMLGMELFSQTGEDVTSGLIVETEAYAGITDKASHAWNGRRTARTEIMYAQGGTVYVYLCYGVHSLFNVVTNKVDVPDAVLVRALMPVKGIELMLKRLRKENIKNESLYGPGNVTKAMGIHFSQSGMLLGQSDGDGISKIWIEQGKSPICKTEIATGKRIGVDYAGEDALRPYRFTWKITMR